jgi:hypothetical protein
MSWAASATAFSLTMPRTVVRIYRPRTMAKPSARRWPIFMFDRKFMVLYRE